MKRYKIIKRSVLIFLEGMIFETWMFLLFKKAIRSVLIFCVKRYFEVPIEGIHKFV